MYSISVKIPIGVITPMQVNTPLTFDYFKPSDKG